MPHTLAALECGALSEWRATILVRESACLDREDRSRLDTELCSDVKGLDGMGDAALTAAAKAIAYRLDPHAVVDRAARAAQDRGVSIRPAPDTMTYVTALLRWPRGVGLRRAQACGRSVLRRPIPRAGDGRYFGAVCHRPAG